MEEKIFDDIICKYKKPYILNKYNKKNYIIVAKIIELIDKNKEIITKILETENKFWDTAYSIEKFYSVLDNYRKLEEKRDKKFGIGNIIAITNGDIFLQMDLIIKSILANCRIMFIAEPELCDFNTYIISMIQEILEQENLDKELISIVKMPIYKQKIVENEEYIDCLVINKDYDTYNFFAKRMISKVIYLDYGNINIYVDSDKFEEKIDNIVKQANGINIDVYDYRIDDVEDCLGFAKNNFIFNTAIIFSEDIKKCMKMYEIIKAKNIFINTFNIDKLEIDLDIADFQFEKKLNILN